MNHIVHDIDRDGWGSASLLIAQMGAENCRLYPTGDKEVLPLLPRLDVNRGDEIWVLDIPGPTNWTGFLHIPEVQVTWVDHHLNSWPTTRVPGVRIVLPETTKPTTTMKVLIDAKSVQIDGAMNFVGAMCSRGNSSKWAILFDGLASMAPELPVTTHELPGLIAGAVADGPIPECFKHVFEDVKNQNDIIQRVLAEARWQISDDMAIVHISDAHKIKLARYFMAIAARHPDKLRVIVHRSCMLYCGRNSAFGGLNLLDHFQTRRLEPKGHGYVCWVGVAPREVQNELDSLKKAWEGNDD